ncbi:MAG: hypothetical protein E7361_03855 [Clostridiales bacterium]|nr:hypothetical protein [Clostridiales bacterium]
MRNKILNINTILFAIAVMLGVLTIILLLSVNGMYTSFKMMMAGVYIALCFVPMLLRLIFRWKAPIYIVVTYYCFIVLSTLCGTIYGLYNIISFYDILLHALSGVLLAGFGLYIYTKGSGDNSKLIITVLFIIGFAVIVGVLWEIWEYLTDEIMLLNSQRHSTLDGVALTGHNAITDTMIDLISDLGGAVLFAVGYVVYAVNRKRKNKGINNLDKK